MKKDKFKKSALNTIDLQILALRKLKKSIGNSFNQAVKAISDCKSKTIFIGVGKSQKIASLVSSSLSSCAAESYTLSAEDCVHGDLGSISNRDCVVLISNSGDTDEIKPLIFFCNRHNIKLIGITSKKNSSLYKAANIKILIPQVKEGGEGGIVPSSSLITQTSIGSALVLGVMKYKKHGVKKLKKSHPAGSLSKKLLTVEDLMIKGNNNIPFVNEDSKMQNALKILKQKNLGLVIVRNSKKNTIGLLSDGDIKRIIQKNQDMKNLKVKKVMTLNPKTINQDMLVTKALYLMQKNKIMTLCVNNKKSPKKTIGIIRVLNILEANIQ